MKNSKPEWIFIDFDRTLISLYREENRLLILADQMRNYYTEFLEIPETERDPQRDGYFVWHALHTLAKEKLGPDADAVNEEAEKSVGAFEKKICEEEPLFDGVAETVKYLTDRGIRLGLISSNQTQAVSFALSKAQVLPYFSYVTGRPIPFEPELLKPSPYSLLKACQTVQVLPQKCWYIGDDRVDIRAAKEAGMFAVGTATGHYTEKELQSFGADWTIASISSLNNYSFSGIS